MHLTVLTTSYPRHSADDAGIFVKRMVDAFAERGVSGVVVVPRDRDEPEEEVHGRWSTHRFSYGILGRGQLAFGSGIVPKLRRRPWLMLDAVHLVRRMAQHATTLSDTTDLIHANWIGAGVAAWMAHRRTAIPYVVTLRGEDARLLQHRLLRPFLMPVVRNACAVTVVSEEFLALLRGPCGLPKEKTRCIANGAELTPPTAAQQTAFLARYGWNTARRYLVFVGTITPRKRVDQLLRAMPELARLGFDLILCGRTDDTSYVESLKKMLDASLQQHVHFVGAVPPQEIPHFLTLASAYVSASEFEGRPNAVLEALSLGKPAYVSDIPAHREVISPGTNGALFSTIPELITALQQGILTFTPPPARTWRETADDYIACFTSAMGQLRVK